MAMNNAYLNVVANAGRSAITHIGLLNGSGNEVGAARKPVTWGSASNGDFVMTGNLVFDMQAGDNVSSWCGYTALTGGTAYGGQPVTPVTFSNDGTYTLLAASTGINHDAA